MQIKSITMSKKIAIPNKVIHCYYFSSLKKCLNK